ncbi:MAG: hypothetical protein WA814_02675 [Candidatus Baltobacteraceae bacterium]
MSRRRALLLYLALSVPFGIVVHLGSEFAGLGRDADELAFSPLHAYLAIVGIAAFAAFVIAGGLFERAPERRRRIGLMAQALPFYGRGPGFLVLSAALQFAFFAITQLGEGCPLCKGDVLVGVAAALLASVAGSLGLIALRKGIVHVISELGYARERAWHAPTFGRRPRHAARPVASIYSTFAATLGNRPPPLHA